MKPRKNHNPDTLLDAASILKEWFENKERELSATDGPIPCTLDAITKSERREVEFMLSYLFDAVEVHRASPAPKEQEKNP